MKRWAAMLLSVCLGLCLLAGCGDDGSGKGFRFPISADPQQLDPQFSTDDASVTLISVLFEGLTRLDERGKAVPGAADWTVSEDGLTYTFTLRESYWSTLSIRGEETPWDDPVQVVADDFLFAFQRAVAAGDGSPLAEQFYGILNAKEIRAGKKDIRTLGVKAPDERTLVITLAAKDEGFAEQLATTPFMPCNRAFFEYTAGRYGLDKHYVLTNGPFSLASWAHGEYLRLIKNEHYHAADTVQPQAVRFVIAPEDPAKLLSNGALDAAPLTADELDMAKNAGLQVVALEDSIRGVWFNTADGVLKNNDIRRALRDSVEWEAVYAHLQGMSERAATGYVAPAATVKGETYRTPENALVFRTDVAAAQRALDAGLAALYPTVTAVPRMSVLAAKDEQSANLARYLAQSWQKNLKIYTTLTLVSEEELASALRRGRYQIAIATVTATGLSGAENLAAYATRGVDNVTALANGAVDAQVGAALRGGRKELEKLEKTLYETCPSLPLSFPYRYYGIAAGNEGITVRPFGGGTFGGTYEFLQAKKYD